MDTEFFSPEAGGAVCTEHERPLLFVTADAGQADAVLSAVRELLGSLPQRHMVLLVSDATARAQLREKLQNTAPEEHRLHLPESMPLREYRDLLRKAAVVVLMDPEPRAAFLLEAMSCGTAVLLCTSQQQPAVLQHGQNVLRFNLRELVMQTGILLQDHTLLKKLRIHARRTVLEYFCLEEITAKHMKTITDSYRNWLEVKNTK